MVVTYYKLSMRRIRKLIIEAEILERDDQKRIL